MASMNINSISKATPQMNASKADDSRKQMETASFGQWLRNSIEDVNRMQHEAKEAAMKLTTGENKDIHGTMIAMQKADVTMNLMLAVRNKIIAAYDEIKRMPI